MLKLVSICQQNQSFWTDEKMSKTSAVSQAEFDETCDAELSNLLTNSPISNEKMAESKSRN